MDTTTPAPNNEPGPAPTARPRRVTRVLLGIALAAFALPFLTVTCNGAPTTVSGVQAATKIDIYPNDPSGERELTEEEPANLFAFLALAGTVIALALASRPARDRGTVWFAGAGAILLWGFFLYAFFRTIGNVLPGRGLAVATATLVAAAWTAVETAPRWIVATGAAAAVGLVAGTFGGNDPHEWNRWLFFGFYAGGILATMSSVAAIRASVRPAPSGEPAPGSARLAVAGLVGTVLLAAVAVGGPWLAGSLLDSSEYGASSIGSSVLAALVLLGLFVGASAVALVAGGAIVRGRSRRSAVAAPMQHVRA